MHAYVILLVLALNSPQDAIGTRDAKALEAAKNTNIHQIDPSLPDKSFALWLRELAGPQAEIRWEVNDCGEQTGNPPTDKGRDFPMCAEAQVSLGGKGKLYVLFSVGTFKTGVGSGAAGFFNAEIVESDGRRNWVKKLSGIPAAIKAIK